MKHVAHYRLVRPLGHAALGEIHEAYDERNHRSVALRTMELGAGVDPEVKARFEREAQAVARLAHPNIVTVLDHGESGDTAWMATELLDGRTLKEIIQAKVALSWAQIVDIVGQLADGLDHAHRQGVVHRDIKPGNLVVLDGPRLKIVDFSVAHHANDQLTRVGSVIGTPRYMSPEQARGLPVDERSDIYAIGVILYELLTGTVPFEGRNFVQIATQVVNQKPVAPSTFRAVPPALALIAGRCMAKRPQDRYSSAGAVAADLRRYASLAVSEGALAEFYSSAAPLGADRPVPSKAPELTPTAGAETVPHVRDVLMDERLKRGSRKGAMVWFVAAAVVVVAIALAVVVLR